MCMFESDSPSEGDPQALVLDALALASRGDTSGGRIKTWEICEGECLLGLHFG